MLALWLTDGTFCRCPLTVVWIGILIAERVTGEKLGSLSLRKKKVPKQGSGQGHTWDPF